jgi:hypothetical protein
LTKIEKWNKFYEVPFVLSGGKMVKKSTYIVVAILSVVVIVGMHAIWKKIIEIIGYKQTVLYYQLEPATLVFACSCSLIISAAFYTLKYNTK